MKILFVAWSVYDSRIEKFSQNSNGTKVIIDICEYVGRKEVAYLFIGSAKLSPMELGYVHVVGTEEYEDVVNEDLPQEELWLLTMTRAFAATLDNIHPDIVSIQGLGEFSKRCMLMCKEKGFPYVYTEHLYIEKKDILLNSDKIKKWRHNIYTIPEIRIIAVSKGMKRKILKDFPNLKGQVDAIANGTNFKADIIESDLVDKYHLHGKKVLLCVGTIHERKNQRQIVRAFQLLPEEIQKNIKILFCGRDCRAGHLGILLQDIEKAGLVEQLIYTGNQGEDDMKKFYSISDGLIMPSLAEGLSLAMLENIAYGQPVILFRDSECMEDISDEGVVQIAEERSDVCLADAIVKWYEKEWNKEYIVDFSKYFTMERMADDYIDYFKETVNEKVVSGK